MSLLDKRTHYKPFNYPFAYEGYQTQLKMHWSPEEIPLASDVRDWKFKLTDAERNLLTQVFRFFTAADVDVAYGYNHKYIPVFGHQPEVAMMLNTFAAMEAVHVDAYSLLLDTVGMPEIEYQAFAKYKEMKAKHDYLEEFDVGKRLSGSYDKSDIAKSLAVYSAFTEGLQLFSSFAILSNFPRHGKMIGMGKVVTWSQRDESVHTEYMIKLFRTFIEENYHLWTDEFKKELYDICRKMVELEDNFIDLAFSQGGIEGLDADEVKQYIRYIADRRLLQLGLKTEYKVKNNPLPWLDEILNSVEHTNFFENRVSEYQKGGLKGDWNNVWA